MLPKRQFRNLNNKINTIRFSNTRKCMSNKRNLFGFRINNKYSPLYCSTYKASVYYFSSMVVASKKVFIHLNLEKILI